MFINVHEIFFRQCSALKEQLRYANIIINDKFDFITLPAPKSYKELSDTDDNMIHGRPKILIST